MPAGPRIRANNAYGVITDAPLTAGATVFNSSQLQLLPAVLSAHAVVVLDPKRVNGEPEIVIVTNHAGLATSATITRAAYGTISRSHPAGTAWAHVTIDEDYIKILTSSTRPIDPYIGQSIFETDSLSHRIYNGTTWNSSPPIGSVMPYLGATAPTGYILADGVARLRADYPSLYAVILDTYPGGNGVTTFGIPNMSGRVLVGRDTTQAEFDVLGEIGGVKSVILTTAQMPVHPHGITDVQHSHGQTPHGHGNDAHDHGATSDDNETGSHRHGVGGSGAGANDIIWRWTGSGEGLVQGSNGMRVTGTSMDWAGSHNHDIWTDVWPNSINIWGANANIQSAYSGFSTTNAAGSGEAHTNLQPYIVVNYIIKI